MKRAKWLMASMTLIVVLLLGAACNSEETSTPREGANAGGTSNLGSLASLRVAPPATRVRQFSHIAAAVDGTLPRGTMSGPDV